jgi:hypothetical protein
MKVSEDTNLGNIISLLRSLRAVLTKESKRGNLIFKGIAALTLAMTNCASLVLDSYGMKVSEYTNLGKIISLLRSLRALLTKESKRGNLIFKGIAALTLIMTNCASLVLDSSGMTFLKSTALVRVSTKQERD